MSVAPRVLVTRPLPQGGRTAEKLIALGYAPVLAPMLRIEAVRPPDELDLSGVQALLVTSTNGVQHFAALTTVRTLPVLAVGERTEGAARDLGFETVTAAEGDGASLLRVARGLDRAKGSILHARGVDTAVSFDALAKEGFDFHEVVVYRAVLVPEFPDCAKNHRPDAVLIYSARTAEAFAAALSRSGWWDHASDLLVVGISSAALRPLQGFGIKRLFAADWPHESAVLEVLQAHLQAPE